MLVPRRDDADEEESEASDDDDDDDDEEVRGAAHRCRLHTLRNPCSPRVRGCILKACRRRSHIDAAASCLARSAADARCATSLRELHVARGKSLALQIASHRWHSKVSCV